MDNIKIAKHSDLVNLEGHEIGPKWNGSGMKWGWFLRMSGCRCPNSTIKMENNLNSLKWSKSKLLIQCYNVKVLMNTSRASFLWIKEGKVTDRTEIWKYEDTGKIRIFSNLQRLTFLWVMFVYSKIAVKNGLKAYSFCIYQLSIWILSSQIQPILRILRDRIGIHCTQLF